MKHQMNSLIPLLKLLDCEGFTVHVANMALRYSYRKGTERQRQRYMKNRKAFSVIMKGMSQGDRHTVGKFIANLQKMSFDAGLKVGLGSRLTKEES